MKTRPAFAIVASLVIAAVAGCDNGDNGGNGDEPVAGGTGSVQTRFPGQVSAGGATSGEIMARTSKVADTRDPSGTPGIPQGSGGNTGGAAMGGTSGAEGGATGGLNPPPRTGGTPGIPEGAGGTPSGAAMGGTSSGAAASQAEQEKVKLTEEQAEAAKKEKAAKEKQQLAASMDTVAERWRSNAKARGWEISQPTSVQSTSGFDASASQSSASGQPEGRLSEAAADFPIRSEKHGTAPPSEDAKKPAEKGK